MTVSDVLSLLDAERDERGMRNWERQGSNTAGMRSYGIGLTRLRTLAKQIGRNRELAHTRHHAQQLGAHDTCQRITR